MKTALICWTCFLGAAVGFLAGFAIWTLLVAVFCMFVLDANFTEACWGVLWLSRTPWGLLGMFLWLFGAMQGFFAGCTLGERIWNRPGKQAEK